ncbi:MAG TPA: endonuclease/exonuclease/phosphatase family protein [Acidimicrobiales bacterium]|nr:endonuclease/exonuclease/phosphatase family protein [Acidimicrobiales bacterium]
MLRVMTLNIWNLSGPWRERREEIAVWIGRLAPDVVCLQEVVQDAGGRDQAGWLAEHDRLNELGYTSTFARGLDLGEGRWFGNAVLTRHPVDATTSTPLPKCDQDDEGRVLLHVRTAGVDVFCTHLNWQLDHGYVRRAQILTALDAIEAQADPASTYPAVFAGDFNAEPQSDEIRFLTGRATLEGRSTIFHDAWDVAGGRGEGWTWDNRNPFVPASHEPDKRLDYILVRPPRPTGAGEIESCRVVCNRALTGTMATDHYGVVAELAPPA